MIPSEDASEAPPLRVPHVLRRDHGAHVGRDLVQLRETVAALRRHGIDTTAATLKDAPEDPDVVQVYNVQLPAELIATVRAVRRRWPTASIVLSPIFAQTSAAAFRSGQPLTIRKAARALVGD